MMASEVGAKVIQEHFLVVALVESSSREGSEKTCSDLSSDMVAAYFSSGEIAT
jgi:hypothetical protein